MRRIVARRKCDRAVVRVRLEHDLRRPLPFDQPVGPGPDGPAHDVVPGGFDRLARNGEHVEHGEPLEQRVVELGQPKLQHVPVDRAQAFDRRVVVELPAGLARHVDDRPSADDEVGQRGIATAAQIRIEPPLDRVDVVLGNELARPLERRIVGEADALLQPDRPGPTAVGELRHRLGGVRHDARRVRQIVELVEALENVRCDARGAQIRALLRIQAGDVAQRNAQHLAHVGGKRGRARPRGERKKQEHEPDRGHHGLVHSSNDSGCHRASYRPLAVRFATSMSRYFHDWPNCDGW